MRLYVNTAGQELHPETSTNWGFGGEFAPTTFLRGLDLQLTWYQVKINGALRGFANPNTNSVNDPGLGFAYIVPTDIAKAGVDLGDFGAWNTGITGTYYLFQRGANFISLSNPAAAAITDIFHTTLAGVGGIAQNGVESLPRMRYRARLGWSNGAWSVTGFMDY